MLTFNVQTEMQDKIQTLFINSSVKIQNFTVNLLCIIEKLESGQIFGSG